MEKIHPETGEVLHRDIRPMEFCYKGESIIVDMPGWYPAEGDDGIFTQQDMNVSDKALDILRARVRQRESLQENFSIGNIALA